MKKISLTIGLVGALMGVGAVAAKAEKTEETIRNMDGVKDVKNLLQVVAPSQKKRVDAKDSDVKIRVEASLETSKTMDDIKVASVDNGVLLLSGKTQSLGQKLLALEYVYTGNRVHRMGSEIETVENWEE